MREFFRRLIPLLLATLVTSHEKPVALIGTLLLTNTSLVNGTLLIVNRHIAAVGTGVRIPTDALVIHTDGIILPGLIDVHNHLTWNIFPRWKPTKPFASRYDWQRESSYGTLLEEPHRRLIEAGLSCEMQRYAEVKAISQGVTSVIGSLRHPCNEGLARNLDNDPALGRILYDVFPLQMSDEKLQEADETLSSNGALFIHLAEGSIHDGTTAAEFALLKERHLLRPGLSIIHGIALTDEDFRAMSNASVGFVWSPRSNHELYGETANLQAALESQIVTAIAPDWSPTGSDGLLSELNYAVRWNAERQHSLFDARSLLAMATVNPAKLVHLDQRLGALREGFLADVVVLRSDEKDDPFDSVTNASPKDVLLVIIDGQPVYGDRALMERLVSATSTLEELDVCGTKKSIAWPNELGVQRSFRQTQRLLDDALRRWGQRLASITDSCLFEE